MNEHVLSFTIPLNCSFVHLRHHHTIYLLFKFALFHSLLFLTLITVRRRAKIAIKLQQMVPLRLCACLCDLNLTCFLCTQTYTAPQCILCRPRLCCCRLRVVWERNDQQGLLRSWGLMACSHGILLSLFYFMAFPVNAVK